MQSSGLEIIKEENRLNNLNIKNQTNSVDFKDNTFGGRKSLLKKEKKEKRR